MEKIILNETPKTTSKSFKINNIEIEKFELPQLKEFNNMRITPQIKTESKKNKDTIKYNISQELTKQAQNRK